MPADESVVWWNDIMSSSGPELPAPRTDPDDLATILYSGGTTGLPKGIMLSHHNVTSEAMQVAAWVAIDERDVVLAVLPIFHGFGLGAGRPRRPAQRGEARDGAAVQRRDRRQADAHEARRR